MKKIIGLLIILVVAYNMFVGTGVNPTAAALIVMAGLFGTLSLKVFANV